MSIWVKICKDVDFGRKYFPKISILVKFSKISVLEKIVERSKFWTKLSKILDFGRKFNKMSILVKIDKNLKFGRNFQNVEFGQNL